MELNSVILDKERQILDLQEMCREQDQVAQAKTKAFQIMQHKFMEASSRTTKECSTETDEKVFTEYNNNALNGCLTASSSRLIRSVNKTFLPGHAVMQIKTGDRHSPPPVDPSEDHSSFTTEKEIKDIDVGSKNSERNKNRKRVTFDLPPQQNEENGNKDDVAQTIIDLTSENDELRRIIQEMEINGEHSAKDRIEKLEAELEQLRHDGKNLVFKARAASQTRIRELEEKIASMETKYNIEVETMKSKEETLRNAREWLLEENGKLMEQLSSLRQKIDDLREELNESLSEREKIRLKLENDRELIVKLADDLEDTRATATVLLEQKISILDDVERLKEALEALEEYIEVLETDIFIYEQHVGILRDSLGVSQIDRRTLIKSKAFETKLKALELEKDQMVKINNDK